MVGGKFLVFGKNCVLAKPTQIIQVVFSTQQHIA